MAKRNLSEEDLPANSRAARIAPIRQDRSIREEGENIPEPKKLVRTIPGRAVLKKKTFTQSIAHSLVGGETRDVGMYILRDVLIPAAKNLIQEMVTSGIEMFLFGEPSGRGRPRDKDRGKSIVSYGNYYKDRDREERRPTRVARDKFDLGDIFFKDHNDAEDVLTQLCEALEEYEQVTVADYFELAGIDGSTWTHHKWGWEDLRRAKLTHTRHGYAIILPDPIELD